MKPTYFIAFEGLDGCGKDTQLPRLVSLIKEDENFIFGDKYSTIWVTREPTKITPAGREISNYIRGKNVDKDKATQLFIQDRIQHSSIIRDMLVHSHVLTSRFDLSTLTYQVAQGMDFDKLYELHQYGAQGTKIPDITILFDLPVSQAVKRSASRNSKQEFFEREAFQEKVYQTQEECLQKIARYDGRTILRVPSYHPLAQSVEEEKNMTTKAMYNTIKEYLNTKPNP